MTKVPKEIQDRISTRRRHGRRSRFMAQVQSTIDQSLAGESPEAKRVFGDRVWIQHLVAMAYERGVSEGLEMDRVESPLEVIMRRLQDPDGDTASPPHEPVPH